MCGLTAACGAGGNLPVPSRSANTPVPTRVTFPVGDIVIREAGFNSHNQLLPPGRDYSSAPGKVNTGNPIGWVGHLSRAHEPPLTLQFVNLTGPGPHPRTVWQGSATPSAGTWVNGVLSASQMKAHHLIVGKVTVTYELQYLRAGNVVASGSFQLIPIGGGPPAGYGN